MYHNNWKTYTERGRGSRVDKIAKRSAFLINLLYFAAVVAIVVLALRFAVPWLMPFIIGFAVAMIFHPLIKWTAKKLRAPRKVVACVVVVLGFAILVTVVVFGTIELVTLLSNFFGRLPGIFETQIAPTVAKIGDFFEGFYDELPPDWVTTIQTFSGSLSDAVRSFVTSISTSGVSFLTGFISAVPGFLIALVFTILASFFVTMNYDQTKDFLMAQLSDRGREIVRAVKIAMKDTVFSYFRAYFKLMVLTFIELAIGLTVIGVDNSVGIAFGVAIFDLLPVFGTGGIIIPWIVIDFIVGNTIEAVGLLVVYGIITVVRNFIEPKIVGDQLGLNPVVSIIAIYLGFVWFGVFGMILMPIAVQIANSLHAKGTITLYKNPPPSSVPEKERAKKGKKKAPPDTKTAAKGETNDGNANGES